MDNKITIFTISFIIFFFSFLFNFFFSKKFNFVDIPGENKIHKFTKISAGGIFSTFFLNLFIFQACLNFPLNASPRIWLLPILFLLFYITAIMDFFRGVPAVVRLVIYVTLSYISLSALPHPLEPEFLNHTPKILVAFIVYYLIFFINVTNFSDGIDGNLFIMVLSICLSLLFLDLHFTYLQDLQAILLLLLVSYFLAYLFFNLHPSKMFLSDIGTIPISFLLGWIILSFAKFEYLAAVFILPMYYFVDIGLTLLIRIFKKKNIFVRHNTFFFQRMINSLNYSNYRVNLIMIINNILLFLITYLCFQYNDKLILFVLISIFSQIILLFLLFRKKFFDV